MRPIRLEINLSAIKNNLNIIRKKCPDKKIWAVCKCDAYGHGIANILDSLHDVDGIAVLELEEALLLRKMGWTKRILLLEGPFEEKELEVISNNDIILAIHSDWQIKKLSKTSCEYNIYIKINTGMNRLGFLPEEVETTINLMPNNVKCIGLLSHLANSELTNDRKDCLTVKDQINRLKPIVNLKYPLCISNSGGILFHSEIPGDEVRVGIAMYGISPGANIINLKPVITLKAKIISIREIKIGEYIGYGSTWKATRNSKIAVIACGYGDGFPRECNTNTEVMIEGQRAPIVGAISMDMITVDITDIKNVNIDSWAELFGENIGIELVAQKSNRIPYEILCNLNKRVHRVLVAR